MSSSPAPLQPLGSVDELASSTAYPAILRSCEKCDEEDIQRKPAAGGVDRAGTSAVSEHSSREIFAERRAGGASLPLSVLSFMEPRFGRPLDDVRVHTSDRASKLARDLHARAFTVGKDVFFRSGEYRPSTSQGRRLIAHELAHTIQQSRGSVLLQRSMQSEGPEPSCKTTKPGIQEWFADEVLMKIRTDPVGANKQLLAQSSENPKVQQAIRLVQRALAAWGCEYGRRTLSTSAVDGMYTPQTRAAVKAFQATPKEALGPSLAVDGIVGPLTVRELDLYVSKTAPKTEPKSEPDSKVPSGVWKDFKITVKSYIAHIGDNYTGTPCAAGDPAGDVALSLMAQATDSFFDENPLSDAQDTKYRLYSSRWIRVRCDPSAPELITGIAEPLETDTGTEPPGGPEVARLHAPELTVQDEYFRNQDGGLSFGWFGMSRPHRLAEIPLQAVCPRTGKYIWHRIMGRFVCGPDGTELRIRIFDGSKFPSHRLFVNGRELRTRPQGDFALLWKAHRSDRSLVG
ncbi:eCIS core domain-containing protein [Nannocystis pusilla]|uniref:eCIS core domain-containing protein n=1 Tax=Nannocystis pusilla TaxID=889268 RepID=UPI003BF44801